MLACRHRAASLSLFSISNRIFHIIAESGKNRVPDAAQSHLKPGARVAKVGLLKKCNIPPPGTSKCALCSPRTTPSPFQALLLTFYEASISRRGRYVPRQRRRLKTTAHLSITRPFTTSPGQGDEKSFTMTLISRNLEFSV